MNRSRIIQGVILLVLFIIAVVLFSGGSAPVEDSSGYVPPNP